MPAAISPILEFIEVVAPGAFAAHWGYLIRDPLSTGETEPVGPGNRFSPAPEDRGQPTSFVPGRQYNVFATPLSGTLSWILRGRSATAGLPGTITPTVTSVVDLGDGLKRVTFGYTQSGRQYVRVSQGPMNEVSGGCCVVGSQPESFQPGTVTSAFSVVTASDELATWTVLGVSASG